MAATNYATGYRHAVEDAAVGMLGVRRLRQASALLEILLEHSATAEADARLDMDSVIASAIASTRGARGRYRPVGAKRFKRKVHGKAAEAVSESMIPKFMGK